jgi:serine O-acetyltransferase
VTGGGAPASPPAQPRHWGLRHDCEKYYTIIYGTVRPSLPKRIKSWVGQFQLQCIAVYRLGQLGLVLRERARLLGAPLLVTYAVLNYLVRLVHKVEIQVEARIGPALFIGHPHSIIVGPGTIGSNCNLAHHVTIGEGLGATGSGVPTLGDGVWIGTGCTLTGPITIGSGAVIAAGSVVSRDAPPRSLLVGNPARVVASDYDNRPLLGYTLPTAAADGCRSGSGARGVGA